MNRASYWTADENSAPTHPTAGKAAHRLSRQIRMNLTWHSQTQPGEPLAGRNPDHTPDQDAPGWMCAIDRISLRGRLREVIRTGAQRGAQHFSQSPSIAAAGECQLRLDRDARAFTKHQSVTGGIPRPACLIRFVVA